MVEKIARHRIILWLKNDLRMHDNPVFDWALKRKSILQA